MGTWKALKLRLGIATVLGAALAGLVACGGGGSTSTATVGTSVAGGPDLSSELLTVQDLPTGWSVYNSSSSSSSSNAPECLNGLTTIGITPSARAEAQFQGGASGIPQLDERLGYYQGTQAHDVLSRFDNALSGCTNISVSNGGSTATGSIGAMSFPSIGDESTAYQMSLSSQGFSFGFDIVVARKGQTDLLLIFADLGSPDVSMLQDLAQKAISKIA